MFKRHLHWTEFPKRKVLFIVPTQKQEKDGHLPVEDDLTEIVPPLDWEVDLHVEYDNSAGLGQLYNKELDTHRNYDWIIFAHDDIRILSYDIYHRLLDAERRGYDVVGVAGAKGYEIPNPTVPTGWWSPPNRAFGLAGFVSHNIDGKSHMTVYGPAPQRVLVIDGLFIAISRHALEKGLRFDEDFDFHGYDISLCLRAWQLGIKCGVEPIYVEHASPGTGFNSDAYLRSQMKLYEKFFTKKLANGIIERRKNV